MKNDEAKVIMSRDKIEESAKEDEIENNEHESNDKELIGAGKDEFHLVTQKLLFVCKRARPDIETVVAYMCTRVTKSTEGDWGKWIRVLKFLKCTIDDTRVMGMNHDGIYRHGLMLHMHCMWMCAFNQEV